MKSILAEIEGTPTAKRHKADSPHQLVLRKQDSNWAQKLISAFEFGQNTAIQVIGVVWLTWYVVEIVLALGGSKQFKGSY